MSQTTSATRAPKDMPTPAGTRHCLTRTSAQAKALHPQILDGVLRTQNDSKHPIQIDLQPRALQLPRQMQLPAIGWIKRDVQEAMFVDRQFLIV